MRMAKMMCHRIFDSKWQGKPNARKKRNDLYIWLAGPLDIPVNECHFGHFDMQMLKKLIESFYSLKI